MPSPIRPAFVRRENHHGMMDSICPQCYVTVCTSGSESDLKRAEEDHVCDLDFLARWRRMMACDPGADPAG